MRRSASGAGVRPTDSSFAATKLSIGLRTQAASVFDFGHGRPNRRNQRPMGLVLGAVLDPIDEQFLLSVGEFLLGLRRRHLLVGIVREDSPDHFAGVGVAGHDRFLVDGRLALIEPQLGLPRRAIGPMAREAVLEQNGADVAVVLDRGVGGVATRGTPRQAHVTVARQVSVRRVKAEFMPCGCRLGGVGFSGKAVRRREHAGPLRLANHR